MLLLKGADAEANGYEASEGFVVLKGGLARASTTPSMHPYVDEIRQSLIARGIFSHQGSQYLSEQDYTFNSPSQAAAVLMGRNANGRIEWKTKSGDTLKELQEGAANTIE
jgi:virulence-associated protein VapD